MQSRVNRESMIWTAALNGFLANPNVDVISNADNALQRGLDFADKLVRAAQIRSDMERQAAPKASVPAAFKQSQFGGGQ